MKLIDADGLINNAKEQRDIGIFHSVKDVEAVEIAVARYTPKTELELRAAELLEADKDGRVIVLPVPLKIGSMFYSIDFRNKVPILERVSKISGNIMKFQSGGLCDVKDIGVYVFYTRKEAEAALKA